MGVVRILIKMYFIKAETAWPDTFNCCATDCLHYKMFSIQKSLAEAQYNRLMTVRF
jgi:hypothetical protein